MHTWYKEFVEPSDNVEFHNPVQVNRHKNFDIDTFSKFKTPESFLWYIAVTPLFQLCFQMGIKKIGIIGQDGHKIDSNNNNHYGGYTGPDQHVDKIKLGNIDIIRDWGWAPEFIEGIQIMTNADILNDYVICTGKPNTLEAFIDKLFSYFELNWKEHIVIDTDLLRPNDIQISYGNPLPLFKDLGWKANENIDSIVEKLLSYRN